MTRTHERETKHYDFKVLSHLVAAGEATYYEGPGIFVIKTEDGTVAVRPNQVFFTEPVRNSGGFDFITIAETIRSLTGTVAPEETPETVVIKVVEEVEAQPHKMVRGWQTAEEREELLRHFS